jgi:hypothetical protein
MSRSRFAFAGALFTIACSSNQPATVPDGGVTPVPDAGADAGPSVDAPSDEVRFGTGGAWSLDEAKGTRASGDALHGAPAWTVGKIDTALHLDGAADFIATTQPALDGSKSFSVAAWVQLDRVNAAATILALNGARVSGFALGFIPAAQDQPAGFTASFAASDADDAAVARVVAPYAPIADVWYHVAATYDAATREAILYVDGRKVAAASVAATFAASGGTTIGRGELAGAPAAFWPGTLDEVLLAGTVWSASDVASVRAQASSITPVRPPAVPLVVNNPYVNVWMTTDAAPGHWPTFWNGSVKAITGFVRVDGATYVFMGAPGGGMPLARQLQLEVTATQSRFVFAAGAVNLYVNFIAPVDGDDLQKLSVPFGYIQVQAVSTDGVAHATSVYLDISGEWAHGDTNTPVVWTREDLAAPQPTTAFAVHPANPGTPREVNEFAAWGTAVFAAASSGMLSQAGSDATVRGAFLANRPLDGTVDIVQPRAISDRWPVFAYQVDLGMLGGVPSAPRVFAIGNVRQPAVTYLQADVQPLWQAFWPTWQAMVGAALADAASGNMVSRADALDRKIAPAAVALGGAHYAALCALALRQAFAGTELVGTAADPWLLMKEISSSGNLQTVDVVYPSMPAFLYVSPKLVRHMVTPVLEYVESGLWPMEFAPHDLGASYPNASGHNDGGGENMPVEESANMLLMTAAYLGAEPGSEANAYLTAHYATLNDWAKYLVDHALDPENQNQTDDFTGFIAHSSNLALKGILAIGAMGQIARAVGNTVDADHYDMVAHDYIVRWSGFSQDTTASHLRLAYDAPQDTWSLKYNSYPDRLLKLGLIPAATLAEETAWYVQQRAEYGFPLDNRHTYTKADWELWTAAGVSDPALRQQLIDAVYHFADRTPQRVPFTDWYDTESGTQTGFVARPVIGGMFSLMTLPR